MLGQGHRQQQQTRIAILSKRAQGFNDRFDDLERTGVPLKQIPQVIAQEDKAKGEVFLDVLPFDESRKVIEVGSVLTLGFEKTHTVKSEAKEMNESIRKKFLKTKELKASKTQAIKEGLQVDEREEMDATERAKEQDKKMKERIYKDHLAELSGKGLFSIPKKSVYGAEFDFNNMFQKECDNQNFDHHFKKNDLKWYSEAYVRHKGTMRK